MVVIGIIVCLIGCICCSGDGNGDMEQNVMINNAMQPQQPSMMQLQQPPMMQPQQPPMMQTAQQQMMVDQLMMMMQQQPMQPMANQQNIYPKQF